jgi:hypothetical protein
LLGRFEQLSQVLAPEDALDLSSRHAV